MSQLQHLLAAPGGGPVNWDLARQVAASQLSRQPATRRSTRTSATPSRRRCAWPTSGSSRPPRCPSGIRTSVAWNRNEWIYKTLDVWRKLCDPVADRMVAAMGDLVPPEARAQLGPMQSMVTTLGGALFGGQLGQALGSLAAEVLSAGDIGLPLGPAGTAALMPANIRAYGEGLELPEDEVRLYVALREAAHQRLFQHVPWLRGHVLGAVEMYASGISVNREAIEEAMGRVDPANPESMQAMALEGHLHPGGHPGPAGVAGPAGDRARAGRGLGLPRGGQRRRRPAAERGTPGRGVPPPPGRRRPRRADLRHPGRAGAAAAPAARGRRPLGCAHRAPRGRRARRALGTPGPAPLARRTSPTRWPTPATASTWATSPTSTSTRPRPGNRAQTSRSPERGAPTSPAPGAPTSRARNTAGRRAVRRGSGRPAPGRRTRHRGIDCGGLSVCPDDGRRPR